MHRISRRDLLRTAVAAGALGGIARKAFAAPVTLDALKKTGEMRIGVEVAYPPFVFRDKGAIVGYDVDLAGVFCTTLGVKPNFIDTQWSGVIPSLYAGRFDIIMASMSITKERVQRVAFSIPYAEASQALLVRQEDRDKIKAIEDMSDRILGIKLGSPGEVLHKRIAERLVQVRGKGFKDVKTYDDHPAAYLALAQGTVDGVLNTLPTLAQVTKDQSLAWQLIEAGAMTAEEAKAFEHANIILQALGVQETVEVVLSQVSLRKGDVALLCSDGLHGPVADEEMLAVLIAEHDLGKAGVPVLWVSKNDWDELVRKSQLIAK